MPFVVKAAPGSFAGDSATFHEKTMYRGRDIGVGDEIFVFASENQGGRGLCARGVVTKVGAAHGKGVRVEIEARLVARSRRPLGRAELKPFRTIPRSGEPAPPAAGHGADGPQTEIDFKLYRQATNKIARISDEAGAFLMTHF